jgi:uncharacterized paraquat-inducible protein A
VTGILIPPEVNPPVYCQQCGWSGQLIQCSLIADALAMCPRCSADVVTVDEPTIREAK